MSEKSSRTPQEVCVELYTAFKYKDMDRMAGRWADDAVYHSVGDGIRHIGKDAIMNYTVEGLLRPFPDVRATTHKLVVHGDQVIMDVTAEGTQTGRFSRVTSDGGGIAEMPPTNRRIVSHAVEWFAVTDGFIVEDRIFFDRMQVLTHLGLAPQPEPA